MDDDEERPGRKAEPTSKPLSQANSKPTPNSKPSLSFKDRIKQWLGSSNKSPKPNKSYDMVRDFRLTEKKGKSIPNPYSRDDPRSSGRTDAHHHQGHRKHRHGGSEHSESRRHRHGDGHHKHHRRRSTGEHSRRKHSSREGSRERSHRRRGKSKERPPVPQITGGHRNEGYVFPDERGEFGEDEDSGEEQGTRGRHARSPDQKHRDHGERRRHRHHHETRKRRNTENVFIFPEPRDRRKGDSRRNERKCSESDNLRRRESRRSVMENTDEGEYDRRLRERAERGRAVHNESDRREPETLEREQTANNVAAQKGEDEQKITENRAQGEAQSKDKKEIAERPRNREVKKPPITMQKYGGLTAENLSTKNGDFVPGGASSTLARGLGDMTRTMVQGYASQKEVDEWMKKAAEDRKRG